MSVQRLVTRSASRIRVGARCGDARRSAHRGGGRGDEPAPTPSGWDELALLVGLAADPTRSGQAEPPPPLRAPPRRT